MGIPQNARRPGVGMRATPGRDQELLLPSRTPRSSLRGFSLSQTVRPLLGRMSSQVIGFVPLVRCTRVRGLIGSGQSHTTLGARDLRLRLLRFPGPPPCLLPRRP